MAKKLIVKNDSVAQTSPTRQLLGLYEARIHAIMGEVATPSLSRRGDGAPRKLGHTGRRHPPLPVLTHID
jgi:hypothetical protein